MIKARGSIERFDLGELTGQEALAGSTLALRHEGPGIVRRWALRQQQWRLEEARRVRDLLDRLGEELVREVYAEIIEAMQTAAGEPLPLHRAVQTPEGQDAFVQLQREIVAQVAVELSAPYVGVLSDGAAIAEELERLGALSSAWLKAQEVQRLTAQQFPAAAGAGDDGPGEGVALGARAGSAGGAGA